jgi:membrane-bound metal-dependent hydrolase YbcI (DUF457 family)
MPSPIAHIGAGYAVYRVFKKDLPENRRRFWFVPAQLAATAALSLLPDLDTILAVALGDMQRYHNNFTHSLLFAIPVALLCAAPVYFANRPAFRTWFLVCLFAIELHIVMDFFTAERGVMLFWPLTDARFSSPVKLFYGLQLGLGWFSVWHLWTAFTESLFALAAILFASFIERRRTRKALVLAD